jgi:transposase-like protein
LSHSTESYENVAVLVVMTINKDGQRGVIAVMKGEMEDFEKWMNFLVSLKQQSHNGSKRS